MRARILLALSFLVPFAGVFLYVWSTATDLAFRDDMYLIKGGPFEAYCSGTLTLADLWRPAAATRWPGYCLLQIANIRWFGMNCRLIVLLIPFLMLGSAMFIYRDFKKSLAAQRSPEFIAAAFVALSAVIFNVITWEGLTFGYGFCFQSPMFFFLATFVGLQAFLETGARKWWPAALVLPALAVPVFGGTHCFSFAPALGGTFVCYVCLRRNRLPAGFPVRSLLIGVYLLAMGFLYMYRIDENEYFPGFSPSAAPVIASPFKAAQFLLASLGASVVGVDAANAYVPFGGMVILGLVLALLYLLALTLFFTSRMHERTFMPFYLILQALFYLGFMTVGRFVYGMEYGMSSRYTCVSLYGLVAAVWIFLFVLTGPERATARLRVVLCAGVAMIYAGLVLTGVVEWRIQPHRKAYFEKLQDIAMRVDTAAPEELARFEERPELVRDALRLLRQYRLNAYRNMPGARDGDPAGHPLTDR